MIYIAQLVALTTKETLTLNCQILNGKTVLLKPKPYTLVLGSANSPKIEYYSKTEDATFDFYLTAKKNSVAMAWQANFWSLNLGGKIGATFGSDLPKPFPIQSIKSKGLEFTMKVPESIHPTLSCHVPVVTTGFELNCQIVANSKTIVVKATNYKGYTNKALEISYLDKSDPQQIQFHWRIQTRSSQVTLDYWVTTANQEYFGVGLLTDNLSLNNRKERN